MDEFEVIKIKVNIFVFFSKPDEIKSRCNC